MFLTRYLAKRHFQILKSTSYVAEKKTLPTSPYLLNAPLTTLRLIHRAISDTVMYMIDSLSRLPALQDLQL
jgi:hypothetical protein